MLEDDDLYLTDGFTKQTVVSWTLLLTLLAYWLYILWYAATQMIPRAQFTVVFLGGGLLIYALDELRTAIDDGARIRTAVLVATGILAVVMTLYMYVTFDTLYYDRLGYALDYEYALGGALVILVGYIVYHSFGTMFFIVFAASLAYGFLGPYFPGLFRHGGYSVTRTLNILVWQFEGFYGSITRIIAAWVSLFILYAGLLKGYGAFDLIFRIAFKASEHVKSGVAQSAVIASMLIGSINGAPTANAAMTGSITIPLMKQSGIRAESAGAIESVASTGGQVMPPIMGAAAFLMASFLGITYFDVLVAGLLPAAIFFIAVAFAVHYTAAGQLTDRDVSAGERDLDEKSRVDLLFDGVTFGLPFFFLLYLLGIAQWTVISAAFYTCLAMMATGVGVPLLRSAFDDTESIVDTTLTGLLETVDGFKHGALILAPIAVIVAAINGIVDILVMTGVPGVFTLALMDISGGSLLIAAIIAMAICIILGLGMPTVAAYALVSLLVAPALVENFALTEISVHFFVFYSAILSGLTPPIAVVVVIASGVANSNFLRTSIEAVKLSVPLFLLPFTFIYNPEIIMDGFRLVTLFSASLVLVGSVFVSYGLNDTSIRAGDRLRFTGARRFVRGLYVLIGAVLMVHPTFGVRLTVLLFGALLYLIRRKPGRSETVPEPVS